MNHSLCSRREAELAGKTWRVWTKTRKPKEPKSFGFYSHMKTPLSSALYCTSNCRPTTLTGRVTLWHSCVSLTSCTTGSVSQQWGCEPACLVTDLWHTAQLWLNIEGIIIKKRRAAVVCVASCPMLNQSNDLIMLREILFVTVLHSTNTMLYIIK